MGFKGKLITSMLVAVVLPLTLGWAVSYYQGSRFLENVIASGFQSLAKESSGKIDLILSREIDRLKQLALNPQVVAAVKAQAALHPAGSSAKEPGPSEQNRPVTGAVLNNPASRFFQILLNAADSSDKSTLALFATDANGWLAASANAHPSQHNPIAPPQGISPEGLYWGGLRSDEKSGQFVFDVGIPVLDEERRVVGALWRTFSSQNFFAPELESIRFGETGHLMVIDEAGRVVQCPILPPGSRLTEWPAFLTLASPISGWLRSSSNGHGGHEASVMGYSPLSGVNRHMAGSNGGHWHVVAWQPEQEVFGPARGFFAWNIYAIFIALFCVAVIGRLAANRVTGSISKLCETTRCLEQGLEIPKTDETVDDEIGELSRSFNRMALTLKTTREAETHTLLNLQTALQNLGDNELRLRTILDTMVEGLVVIDEGGFVRTFNPAAEKIYGWRVAEIVGKKVNLLMVKPDADLHDQYLKNYLQTGQAKIIGIGREVRGLRKNGEAFPMELSVNEMQVAGQRHFIGVVRDITERKRGQEQLLAAKETAERANRTKSEFLSRMSHELRTPLNIVLGFGQLLEFNPETNLTPVQRDNVGQIINAGNHLLDLINEILDLSHLESGRLSIKSENVDLGKLALEVLLLAQPLAEKSKVVLENRAPAIGKVFAHAAPLRLKQCLINLISNAIKYNKTGGAVTLAYEAHRPGFVKISVKDTGDGIPPEKLVHLFQPFERLGQEHGEISGTGIGLSITKKLVELMGGTIYVSSTPGQGALFTIELPTGVKGVEENTSPIVTRVHAPSPSQQTREKVILCIEDNKDNQMLVKVVFQNHLPHMRLIMANNGAEGLALADTHAPDLILLDILMPGMSGLEVLQVLRAKEKFKTLPIIALSAHAVPSFIAEARQAGFNDFLTKPFAIKTFLEVLHSHLPQPA
jgi:PAS domain S-box-containing protein